MGPICSATQLHHPVNGQHISNAYSNYTVLRVRGAGRLAVASRCGSEEHHECMLA